jgi:hypothetical protein
MAKRVPLSFDDDLAAERTRQPAKPFEVRAKALHARPGFDFDDIEGLLEQVEGPAHR